MRELRVLVALACLAAGGCVTTGEPRPAGEPPSTAGFPYPYNSRW